MSEEVSMPMLFRAQASGGQLEYHYLAGLLVSHYLALTLNSLTDKNYPRRQEACILIIVETRLRALSWQFCCVPTMYVSRSLSNADDGPRAK